MDVTSESHTTTSKPRPPPNYGASTPSIVAAKSDYEDQITWAKRNAIELEKQVRIVRVSHMRYQHPDLAQLRTFMHDFGMQTAKETEDRVWYGGYGPDPYVYYAQKGPKKFLGATYLVESYSEIEKAAKIPGASSIVELGDSPGGGYLVTVEDPEGFPVNLLFGQSPADSGRLPNKLLLNYEDEKSRLDAFQRFQAGPAAVHKLGHYGLTVQKFDAQLDFYTRNFNLVPTDFLYKTEDGERKFVGVFAHIDRGEEFVDHHTFFMTMHGKSHVHHCSFEVHDLDTQMLGHQWLAQKGYTAVWGVGRHVLGSQIFDYWWDTTGNMVEHYADGDLVNDKSPITYLPSTAENLAVWGPDVPQWFLE